MLSLLLYLIFIVCVFGIAYWILNQIPIPAPIRMVVNVVMGLIALVILFWLFSSVIGVPHMHRLD